MTIGTAGWAISAETRERFPEEGSALERYAAVFDAVEINSSFHRRHRPDTWRRWAEATPDRFRFAVKLPKTITHGARLREVDTLLDEFAGDVSGLGAKLGVVLVQLPPSLVYDVDVADRFFAALKSRVAAPVACEPRHAAWFEPKADADLAQRGVARVAADPAPVPIAAQPGGAHALAYWRLHGSPRMYRSAYGTERLTALLGDINRSEASDRWCILDNTASSAAIDDALLLRGLVSELGGGAV